MKGLRKTHKYTGVLLLVLAAWHGNRALGGFRLHTGTLLYLMVFLTAATGLLFHFRKKKEILQFHRLLAGGIVLLFLLHFFVPGALSGWR